MYFSYLCPPYNNCCMKKILLSILAFVFVLQSCEIINPPEEIPSYIRVDEAILDITDVTQGSAIHNVSDCWLYVDGHMIGVFEIPFEVPVLASGKVHVEIEPGIHSSGRDAQREVYSMLTNYYIDTVLTAGQTTKITPHYSYRQGVQFLMEESFDQIGFKFETDDSSTYDFVVTQDGALEGNSMYVSLPKSDYTGHFECRTNDVYSLLNNGVTYLELSYKCNDYFNFGMFGIVETATSVTGVRENILTVYPTNGRWSRIYLNLKEAISNSAATDGRFQPFFTAIRVDTLSPVGENSEFFIDNIKLLHMDTEAN